MKILFIANAASIHTVRWVNALSERNEVHLAYKSDDEPKENTISSKVILHRLKYSGTKGYIMNTRNLKQLSKSIEPDIVNAHYASGYGTLARLSRMKPLLLSVWGSDVYDFPYQSKLKRKIIINNLNYADKIASTSKSMAVQVRNLIDNQDKDIAITPFGVDINKFSIKKTKETNKSILIGNIKTLSPKYGIDDFIKSIKILKNNLINTGYKYIADNIKAKIYGDGDQKDYLQSLIDELALEKKVTLEGEIPNSEVPLALSEFDVFCVTSHNESFGVSVVEAMAMELPVVATNVPGFKEVIEDGKTGIIVEKKNPKKIAKALERLILDNELRIEMGIRGRRRVLKLYNWDNNVKKMEHVYKKVIFTD